MVNLILAISAVKTKAQYYEMLDRLKKERKKVADSGYLYALLYNKKNTLIK